MTKKTEAQILQQIQEAVNNVAEEITANHEITETRWNPIAQQMDIDINITLIHPAKFITVEFAIDKDECSIYKFEERFKALMDEVE